MTLRSPFAITLLSTLLPSLALAQPTPPPAQAPPPPSPLTIRLGDADFLIGGFIDALAVSRSTNVGSGPATTFATIPFENTVPGHLNETRLSAQTSRLNLLMTTKVGSASMRSFLEIDFLGNGPGNAFVTANSHTPRMRHAWAQYTRGKFDFTGGQAWTFLMPNRNGLSPASADVVPTQVLDANLHVGLVWARQMQFRFVAHPTKTFAAGVSLENAQPFVGAAVVLPASIPVSEVDAGANPGAPSPYPDIIGKVAFDPQTGKTHQHIEASVLVSSYHSYNSATDTKHSATGTGFSVGGVFEPVRSVRVIGTTLFSSGGGRYMIGLAPDFIVHPDASLSTVGARSGLAGVEAQVQPPTALFGYYGTVHVDQRVGTDAGKPYGYGIAGSTAANKTIDETTVGFNHAFFREPRYGSMQLIVQYSFVKRTPWSVPESTPSSAHVHMFYVSARYVIP